jgi:hypothetical protein
MRRLSMLAALVLMTSAIANTPSFAQKQQIVGTVDQAVSTPATKIPITQRDVTALQELVDYMKATGSEQWRGLQAGGTIRYGSSSDAVLYPATLTLSTHGETRLDVQRETGITSLRMSGLSGHLRREDGTMSNIPLRNAALGLVAFSHLFSSGFPEADLAVADRGVVLLDGQRLHRITLQYPLLPSSMHMHLGQPPASSDLYFTADHLLYKSAALIEALQLTPQKYLSVVTYRNYHRVDGVQIPLQISDTLDGQPLWVLELSAPHSYSAQDSSFFAY